MMYYICYSCARMTATRPFHDCAECTSDRHGDALVDARNPSTRSKYTRHIKGADIDVYDVLRGFDVTCPAIAHAVKKLLAAGQRGHKDRITDLKEALASVQRGIEMEEGK